MQFLLHILSRMLGPPISMVFNLIGSSRRPEYPKCSTHTTANVNDGAINKHKTTLMNTVHDAGVATNKRKTTMVNILGAGLLRRMLASIGSKVGIATHALTAMHSGAESRTRGGDIVDHRRGVDQPVPPLAALFDGTFLGDQPLVQIVTTGHAGGAGVLAT